jgi:cytoskeletal protein RodZ
MGKLIISQKFLQNDFLGVVFSAVKRYSELLNLNEEEIFAELNSAKDLIEFFQIFNKYFKEEIKLKLN